jgi:hypothetical protein
MESEMGRVCSIHGEKRNAYRILVGKAERKRPLGTPRCWWEDSIKMNLRKEDRVYGMYSSGSE